MAAAKPRRTIIATEPPKQAEEANRLFSLCCRLGYSFRNGLEDSLGPVRLNASKNAAPKEEIPNGSNGFGRSGIVDYLLRNFVARRQGTAHNLQHAAVVQYGAPTRLPFNGRGVSKPFAQHLVAQPTASPTRSISAWQTGNVPTTSMTALGWRLPPTKLRRRSVRSLRRYDYVQVGKDQFTPQEAKGYALFRGKARCNEYHRDGGPGEEPLFTDFTASNLGVPRNPALQFYFEATPDKLGYSANPAGSAYVDPGVGFFLRKLKGLSGQLNPDSQWIELAPKFDAKFQVPTLRNVDMRPSPDFAKAYTHNGYFKSSKEVVHFYNTRDVLPRCKAGDPGEKVTCWPPPEDPANLNKRQLGNLKLTDQEEDDLVAFMKTLTDDYKASRQERQSRCLLSPPLDAPSRRLGENKVQEIEYKAELRAS